MIQHFIDCWLHIYLLEAKENNHPESIGMIPVSKMNAPAAVVSLDQRNCYRSILFQFLMMLVWHQSHTLFENLVPTKA